MDQQDNSPQDSQQSPSQDSQADSLPDLSHNPDSFSDPVTEALEWVESQKAAKASGGSESLDGESHTEETDQPTEAPTEKTFTEPAQDPPKEEYKKQEKPKSSHLANFHRQQQQFEAQRLEFQKEKKEFESFKRTIENAKTDRIAALEAMGYKDVKSFLEGLAEDGGRMTPERRELLEMKQWKEAQEKEKEDAKAAREAEESQAAMKRQLDAIRSEVQSKLKSDYATRLVNIGGADEQIMFEMDRLASENGEMPRIEEAIESVENRFRENLKALSSNPEVRKFFQEQLKSSQQSPTASKSRGTISTIGSEVRSPGVASSTEYVPSSDGEKEIAEALAFLEKRRARR